MYNMIFQKFTGNINNKNYIFNTPYLINKNDIVEKDVLENWIYIIEELYKYNYISYELYKFINSYLNSYLNSSSYNISLNIINIDDIIGLILDHFSTNNKDKIYFSKIYDDWIKFIKPYIFQGGYGYSFQTSDLGYIDHQCIRPNKFNDVVISINDDILIGHILLKKSISLSSDCEFEKWNN
jgi:hypothetical protein